MSFVDTNQDTIWTDTDIEARVQAIIRSQISAEDEFKAARLGRKVSPTPADYAFIAMVDGVIAAAIAEGQAAKIDAAVVAERVANTPIEGGDNGQV